MGTSTPNTSNKISLTKPKALKSKLTPGQQNLKNLQMLLKKQKNPVEAAKSVLAGTGVSVTSGAQLKNQSATKPNTQPVETKPNQQFNPKPGRQTPSSSPLPTIKNLPAGITLTKASGQNSNSLTGTKTAAAVIAYSATGLQSQTQKTSSASPNPVPQGPSRPSPQQFKPVTAFKGSASLSKTSVAVNKVTATNVSKAATLSNAKASATPSSSGLKKVPNQAVAKKYTGPKQTS